jgi:sulfate adenylyltransferase
MIDDLGTERFVEVFVATPIEVCEARDVKGIYAKARRGEIRGFTGVDDPYEPPLNPELVLDTTVEAPEACAAPTIAHLAERGFLTLSLGDT